MKSLTETEKSGKPELDAFKGCNEYVHACICITESRGTAQVQRLAVSKARAAALHGLHRTTSYKEMKQYDWKGLDRPFDVQFKFRRGRVMGLIRVVTVPDNFRAGEEEVEKIKMLLLLTLLTWTYVTFY